MPSSPVCFSGSEGHASCTLYLLGCCGFFRYFHKWLFWRLVWDMESKYVYKSHAEQGTVLDRNCMSGANRHAFPCIPRCMTCERELGKQETETIGFELTKKDWDGLANARLDKVQPKCFQQQKCKSRVGVTSHKGHMICAGTAAANANITRLLQSCHLPSDLYGFLMNFSALWTTPIGVQRFNREDWLVLA